MTRIALVNSSAEMGGAELSLLPVAARMASVATVYAMLPARGPLEAKLSAIGVEVSNGFQLDDRMRGASAGYGAGTGWQLLLGALPHQARLLRRLRSLRADVVYCNGLRAQLGAILPARMAGARVVWHVRDFVPPGRAGTAWRQAAKATELIITNSRATADQRSLDHVRERVRVVPNGIDTDQFRRQPKDTATPNRIGMVGHLTPWKGHQRFARVLRSVRASHPTVVGMIAGAPVYDTVANLGAEADLRRYLGEQGLTDCCSINAVTPEDMPRWLSQLTVLVHCPDRPEPFGRGVAEAMAVGVPVVLAGGGGAAEIVGDAGLIVGARDESGAAAAVGRLLTDEELRKALAERSVARVRRLYDERAYAERVATMVLSA